MSVTDSEILEAIKRHGSQRKAAVALGLDRRTVERRMARMGGPVVPPRVLIIDIETKPMQVFTWGMFKQNIAPSQVIDWGGLLCFAAKWEESDEVMFYAEWKDRERMLRAALRLLDEADAVVGWNSQRFDTRKIEAELHRAGMRRPTPYRNVDLMRSQKKFMDFGSNKLESRRLWLGEGGKVDTGGFKLWRDCLAGDREARRLMEEYNRHDVLLTAEELARMRKGGWVRNLPNLSTLGGHVCPSCGSDRLHADKPYLAETRRYPLWVCDDCGTASRSTKCEPGSARLKAVA